MEPKYWILTGEYGEKNNIEMSNALKSQNYYAAINKFKECTIEISFLEKDLHIKNEELRIKTS